ncbi:MAG: hypothetical protein KGI25_09670 [Thaumarchaeota archaeon]|nr:hypothetical protein [Nitrososphaerota archaeon]
MTSQYVWIGITIGVFFGGLLTGYMIFTSVPSVYMMMQNPQVANQLFQGNPQFRGMWMNYMMSNPQAMNEWMNDIIQSPQFMNQWMSAMLKNSQFQQQYMGPWMMVQDPRFMQNLVKQFSIPQTSTGHYAYPIVKTNQVSIVKNAWMINATETYSPRIIQITTGTTVTWSNDDTVVHTVTDLNGTFDSRLIQPHTYWQHDFYNEGKYNYFCTLHPWMKGIIIVT